VPWIIIHTLRYVVKGKRVGARAEKPAGVLSLVSPKSKNGALAKLPTGTKERKWALAGFEKTKEKSLSKIGIVIRSKQSK
jgi:hypothetical protein